MPRAIWTGSLGFGLVNVPVRLYPATEEKDVHFNQFQKGTGTRIKNKRVSEKTGKEVDFGDIVKGYEVSKGKFVMVTPEELASVEPGRSKTIDIEDFVALDEVDPVHFEKTYYLEPDDNEGAKRAYALLREAMADAGRVAIGRFVMRTKQYLAAVRPTPSGVLALETMYFPDEVRDPTDLDVPTGRVKLSNREKRVAKQLVESLSSPWDPAKYEDTYRAEVLALIKRKAKGEDIVVDTPTESPAPVTDLLAALEASINEAKQRRSGSASPKSSPKKATSKRAATRKKAAPKRKTAASKR